MRQPSSSGSADAKVRVWDLAVRFVHWALALLFGFSWWTAETERLAWHMLSGEAILGLVLFRIYWGFAGSSSARFSKFLRGPRAIGSYARSLFRRDRQAWPGHNPMGGWSVAALLALLLAQCGLGLFATDPDGIESGPLDDLVAFETGRRIAHLHGLLFDTLLTLVVVHLAAILFYLLYKRDNLVPPMIHGYKRLSRQAAAELSFVGWARVLAGVALAALAVFAVVTRFRI